MNEFQIFFWLYSLVLSQLFVRPKQSAKKRSLMYIQHKSPMVIFLGDFFFQMPRCYAFIYGWKTYLHNSFGDSSVWFIRDIHFRVSELQRFFLSFFHSLCVCAFFLSYTSFQLQNYMAMAIIENLSCRSICFFFLFFSF